MYLFVVCGLSGTKKKAVASKLSHILDIPFVKYEHDDLASFCHALDVFGKTCIIAHPALTYMDRDMFRSITYFCVFLYIAFPLNLRDILIRKYKEKFNQDNYILQLNMLEIPTKELDALHSFNSEVNNIVADFKSKIKELTNAMK